MNSKPDSLKETIEENDDLYRIDAIGENVEWLRHHDLEENKEEAVRRLGLIKGDTNAVLESLSTDESNGGRDE